jgi:site-specific recombinase XerD
MNAKLNLALREHHGLTLSEFLTEEVGVGDSQESDDDGYQWGIDSDETIAAAEKFIERQHRNKLAVTTIDSYRSYLRVYLSHYQEVHGAADFIPRLQDPAQRGNETERLISVVESLFEHYDSPNSIHRCVGVIKMFHQMLVERGIAEVDPTGAIRNEFSFDVDGETDKSALTSRQVRELVQATSNLEERVMVLAACAWGLRRAEIASLRASQFVLEGETPHIQFENRKNGPGTVSILYGCETLNDRMVELNEQGQWNGYLFPSSREAGHVQPDTITRRFSNLSERAGVVVDDEPANPHAGRRFWYREYSEASQEVAEEIGFITEEQGSSDEETVTKKYLDEESRRRLRRERMRERLSDAFSDSR